MDPAIKSDIDDALGTILKAVHKLRGLHRDAEPRNILYNIDSGKFTLVDFERAEFRVVSLSARQCLTCRIGRGSLGYCRNSRNSRKTTL